MLPLSVESCILLAMRICGTEYLFLQNYFSLQNQYGMKSS